VTVNIWPWWLCNTFLWI